jgi:hypothetical protein
MNYLQQITDFTKSDETSISWKNIHPTFIINAVRNNPELFLHIEGDAESNGWQCDYFFYFTCLTTGKKYIISAHIIGTGETTIEAIDVPYKGA